MHVLADIATGETAWADIFFLIAVILFVVAAVVSLATPPISRFWSALLAVGLAFTALGFLVL